ncbi:unnamed protein product [Victoria cruziana]
MDTTSGAGKHTNGPEDEGVNEAPTSAQKLTVREEDLRRASISSSSFGSSVDGDDYFQLEAGKLGSLGGDSSHCKEICSVEPDKTEDKAGKHSREDGNELSVPTKTDDIPNGKPCVSGNIFSDSAVGSNSDDRSSMKSMSECNLELVIDENIDVHTDVAFKANHSALDYSHVSQSEHYSTYLGFAKQSLVSSANEKPDTYDPNRIPASIFSKPQNHTEWSVASNDSPYNVQEKRVDAQQKPPCILAIPRANSMPRHSDASVRSFAFPVLTADGRSASHKVEEAESHTALQVDQPKRSLFPCAWLSCVFCC